jgi:8-amino-3,8-dideoxy-alpha-D-manno-octulosonate transaminase
MTTIDTKLALDGGIPIRKQSLPTAYPGASQLGEEEVNAVVEVLRSKGLFRFYGINVLGKVSAFEKAFAQRMQAKYGLGVSSGTSALMCGLAGMGVGPGDEVILPGYTYVASAGAIVAAKAVPILCEIDETLMMDPADLERKITDRTKAIMPVHMRGTPCDMDRIMAIASKHHLKVIEDAAQATGASYKGKPVGTFGDIGCYSFQYHKILTAGEGGALVCNDQETFVRACAYHDHGHFPDREMADMSKNPLLGINCRMSEITGAILCEQLKKLDRIIAALRGNRDRVMAGIRDVAGIRLRPIADPAGDIGVCVALYVADGDRATKMAKALKAENINSAWRLYDSPWHNYNYWDSILEKRTVTKDGCPFNCPLYGKPVEYRRGMLPQTDDVLARCIHVEIAPDFTAEDCQDIVAAIRKVASAVL